MTVNGVFLYPVSSFYLYICNHLMFLLFAVHKTGYTGKNCQSEADPCNPSQCLNGGTCVANSTHFRYLCNYFYLIKINPF